MNSQQKQVLDYLRGSQRLNIPPMTLTPMMAVELFGVYRLGAIVYVLRQEGHPIEDANKKPGGGRYERYSRYYYEQEAE